MGSPGKFIPCLDASGDFVECLVSESTWSCASRHRYGSVLVSLGFQIDGKALNGKRCTSGHFLRTHLCPMFLPQPAEHPLLYILPSLKRSLSSSLEQIRRLVPLGRCREHPKLEWRKNGLPDGGLATGGQFVGVCDTAIRLSEHLKVVDNASCFNVSTVKVFAYARSPLPHFAILFSRNDGRVWYRQGILAFKTFSVVPEVQYKIIRMLSPDSAQVPAVSGASKGSYEHTYHTAPLR